MRFLAICDTHDTVVGMRLAGIEGVESHSRQESLELIEKAQSDENIGILLITRSLAYDIQKELSQIKLTAKRPLIVEIPDRTKNENKTFDINDYIRDAIGIKIG